MSNEHYRYFVIVCLLEVGRRVMFQCGSLGQIASLCHVGGGWMKKKKETKHLKLKWATGLFMAQRAREQGGMSELVGSDI